jgi:hypothetical protein
MVSPVNDPNRKRLDLRDVERKVNLAFQALSVVLALGSICAGQTAVQANICELASRPRTFSKVEVQLIATVVTDFIEHTMVFDKGCPAIVANLWIPHELDNASEVRQLRAELRRSFDSNPRRGARVDTKMTGTFLVEGKRRYFRVKSIDSIQMAGTDW